MVSAVIPLAAEVFSVLRTPVVLSSARAAQEAEGPGRGSPAACEAAVRGLEPVPDGPEVHRHEILVDVAADVGRLAELVLARRGVQGDLHDALVAGAEDDPA